MAAASKYHKGNEGFLEVDLQRLFTLLWTIPQHLIGVWHGFEDAVNIIRRLTGRMLLFPSKDTEANLCS